MTPDQRAAVVAEAMSWLHTPYIHHARVKGAGTDCAQILCAVFEACGLVPHVDPGHYARDWHLHRSEEVYAGWLARYARPLADDEQPQPGDIALFRFGRCFSHGGIVVDGGLILHAYLGRGVILSRRDEEPLDGRPVIFWTLTA